MTTTTRDSEPLTAQETKLEDARSLHAVADELARIRAKFTGTFASGHEGYAVITFASGHEGYAVILEELDELKLEVFKKREERSIDRRRSEAIQVAAMAVRFASDLAR